MKKPDPSRRKSRRKVGAEVLLKAESVERAAINRLFTHAVYDGYSYGVRFRWKPEMQKAIKEKLKGYFLGDTTSPHYKSWVFSQEMVEQSPELVDETLAAGEVAAKTSHFSEWLLTAEQDRAAFTRGIEVKIYSLKEGGFLVKTSRYHRSFPKFLRSAGGSWMPKIRCWRYGSEVNLPLMIGEMQDFCALGPEQFILAPGLYMLDTEATKGAADVKLDLGDCLSQIPGESNPWKDAFEGANSILLPEMMLYQQQIADEAAIRAVIDPLPLFEYQKDNAVFMATRPGAGNFSEQGTGKTLTAIAAAWAIAPNKPKLVCCPVNLQYNWRDEVLRLFPDAKIAVVEPDRDAEWVILATTNLDEVKDWADHFAVLVVDEAHQMKESKAFRTQDILMAAQNIPRAYVLTGTPIPNRESELYTLLRVTRHPLGLLPMEEFEERFCGTPEARAKLAAAIRPWFVRVMKLDVLKLPPKHRNRILLEPTEELAERYNEIMDNDQLKGMSKIHALFRLLETFKLNWVMRQIEKLPADEKAIVFTGYNATLDELEAEHESRGIGFIKALVTGATEKKRHGYVTTFRDDESKKVYGGTLAGNSTGLNLQRGNHSYMMTLPWTAAILYQGEDRQHRIGQERPVNVNIPLVVGTIDEAVYDLVVYKAALSDSVLSPEEQEKQNEAAILKAIERPRRLTVQRKAA